MWCETDLTEVKLLMVLAFVGTFLIAAFLI